MQHTRGAGGTSANSQNRKPPFRVCEGSFVGTKDMVWAFCACRVWAVDGMRCVRKVGYGRGLGACKASVVAAVLFVIGRRPKGGGAYIQQWCTYKTKKSKSKTQHKCSPMYIDYTYNTNSSTVGDVPYIRVHAPCSRRYSPYLPLGMRRGVREGGVVPACNSATHNVRHASIGVHTYIYACMYTLVPPQPVHLG